MEIGKDRNCLIGQSVSRFEDNRLIQGGGRFVDDVTVPGLTHGVVLRSPHAHAHIRSLDVDAAKRASGVLTVLTAKDLNIAGFGELPVPTGLHRRNGKPQYVPRYPILAEDRVRWVGDCIAFVVAETVAQALNASELIKVEFDPLSSVTSTAEASRTSSPRVWEDCPDNICFVELIGDKAAVDSAFATAHRIIKQEFVISRVTAASMEPRAAIGEYNADDDRYTLHATLQHTHSIRADLSKFVLNVPENKIRVIVPDVGGSFGMKSPLSNEVALVLIASKLIARPVKWTSTRSEAFLSDAQGRDNVSEAELALDKDGIFLGLRVKTTAAVGAYLQRGMPALTLNAGSLAGCYRTPAIHVDVTAVFTNTNPVRPYRGNGRPEAAYVIERMIDLAAREMKIHPIELRRRNYIPPNAMPFKTGLTFTYDSGEFEKNMDLALGLGNFNGLEHRRADARKRGKILGFGISNTIERAGAASLEGAEIRINRSGSVMLLSGSVAQGQGHETIFKQIVADRIGLDPNEMTYIQGDSDQVYYGEGTNGSRSTIMAGSAFSLACEKILIKARKIAAHIIEVEPHELNFANQVFSSTKTNRTLTLKEVASYAFEPSKLPNNLEPGLSAASIYKSPVASYPNGCHVCELEIDSDTGRVEIVKYSVVDDVGTVINPLLLHGQIHGGVAQGVGQILMEAIYFDSAGQLVTASFMDYAMPRAHDLCSIEVGSNPVPTKTNPLGVKGAGEAGCVGALPAVANALIDALTEFGVKHIDMPVTAERIWQIMQDHHRRHNAFDSVSQRI